MTTTKLHNRHPDAKLLATVWAENAGGHVEIWTVPDRPERRLLRVFVADNGITTEVAAFTFQGDNSVRVGKAMQGEIE